MNLILLLLTTCIFTTTLYPLEDLSAEQLVAQYAWETPHINPKRVMLSETPPWYYFSHSACTEYTQQKQLRNAVTNYICDTKDALLDYAKKVSIHLLKNIPEFILYDCSADTVQAIHNTLLNPSKTVTISYQLQTHGIQHIINRTEFGLKNFELYEGTPLQHIIHHKNYVTLNHLHFIEKNHTVFNTPKYFDLGNALLSLISSSNAYNDSGNFFMALYCANSASAIVNLFDLHYSLQNPYTLEQELHIQQELSRAALNIHAILKQVLPTIPPLCNFNSLLSISSLYEWQACINQLKSAPSKPTTQDPLNNLRITKESYGYRFFVTALKSLFITALHTRYKAYYLSAASLTNFTQSPIETVLNYVGFYNNIFNFIENSSITPQQVIIGTLNLQKFCQHNILTSYLHIYARCYTDQSMIMPFTTMLIYSCKEVPEHREYALATLYNLEQTIKS